MIKLFILEGSDNVYELQSLKKTNDKIEVLRIFIVWAKEHSALPTNAALYPGGEGCNAYAGNTHPNVPPAF